MAGSTASGWKAHLSQEALDEVASRSRLVCCGRSDGELGMFDESISAKRCAATMVRKVLGQPLAVEVKCLLSRLPCLRPRTPIKYSQNRQGGPKIDKADLSKRSRGGDDVG